MLAERCGVTFQQVQTYENGANRVSFSRLVQIAHALGLRIGDLVGDIDQASGFTRNDTVVLEVMGVHGGLDLLKASLPAGLRARVRGLVREMASTGLTHAAASPKTSVSAIKLRDLRKSIAGYFQKLLIVIMNGRSSTISGLPSAPGPCLSL